MVGAGKKQCHGDRAGPARQKHSPREEDADRKEADERQRDLQRREKFSAEQDVVAKVSCPSPGDIRKVQRLSGDKSPFVGIVSGPINSCPSKWYVQQKTDAQWPCAPRQIHEIPTPNMIVSVSGEPRTE